MFEKEIQKLIGKKVMAQAHVSGEVFQPSLMRVIADVTAHHACTDAEAINLVKNATDNEPLNTNYGYDVWCEDLYEIK